MCTPSRLLVVVEGDPRATAPTRASWARWPGRPSPGAAAALAEGSSRTPLLLLLVALSLPCHRYCCPPPLPFFPFYCSGIGLSSWLCVGVAGSGVAMARFIGLTHTTRTMSVRVLAPACACPRTAGSPLAKHARTHAREHTWGSLTLWTVTVRWMSR